jgi:hypothetical protein
MLFAAMRESTAGMWLQCGHIGVLRITLIALLASAYVNTSTPLTLS